MKNNLIILGFLVMLAINVDSVNAQEDLTIISYELSTLSEGPIILQVEYQKPSPEIINAKIISPKTKENGALEYDLLTDKAQWIKMIFSYSDGILKNVKLDVEYPLPETISKHQETYVVLSKKGYKIDFIFRWEDGTIENVQILTRNPPFNDYD